MGRMYSYALAAEGEAGVHKMLELLEHEVGVAMALCGARSLNELNPEGYGIGGLAVGEGQEKMFTTLDAVMPAFRVEKPRYLMGVGRPDDIVGAVQRGVDMFDCVMPTRSGRTGQGFTRRGTLNIRNARHQDDPRPVDAICSCIACTHHSRAYLHHLFRCEEMLGPILLTAHNIQYYQDLMKGLRGAIEEQKLDDFADTFHREQARGDIEALV